MTTVNLRAPEISRASKSDSDGRLSSAKNFHGSLQTVYGFIGLPQHHRVRNSVFPLVVKSMKERQKPAFPPKHPIFPTRFVSTSEFRVKVIGASEIIKGAISPAPEVGVAVFLLKDDKVLFGRRGSLSIGGYTYMLPGGHLEFGESFEECAARELKEETGLEIKNIEFLTVANNCISDSAHVVTIYMRAYLSDSNQKAKNIEPSMCEGWNWYDFKNLPEPMFGPLREILHGGLNPFLNNL